MKEPGDLRLKGLVQGLITTMASNLGALFLIDKDYQVKQVFALSEFGAAQATKARMRMLHNENLLAVVMTGWSGDTGHNVVCEHYPAPGQVETYTLTYPRATYSWTDQDEPDAQDAIEAYRAIWSLERL